MSYNGDCDGKVEWVSVIEDLVFDTQGVRNFGQTGPDIKLDQSDQIGRTRAEVVNGHLVEHEDRWRESGMMSWRASVRNSCPKSTDKGCTDVGLCAEGRRKYGQIVHSWTLRRVTSDERQATGDRGLGYDFFII